MNLTSILKLIIKPAASSSTELRQALVDVDLAGGEAAIEQLEGRRSALLLQLDSDAAIEKVEAEINVATRDLCRRQAAVKELERLIVEAEDREKAATIESKADEAKRLQRLLIEGYVVFDETAAHLAELRGDIERTLKQLEVANAYLAEHGRGDVQAKTPNQLLADQGVSAGDLPSLTYWSCPGYPPFPNAGQVYSTPKPRPFGLAKRLQ